MVVTEYVPRIKNFITANFPVNYSGENNYGNVVFYIDSKFKDKLGKGYYSFYYDGIELHYFEETRRIALNFEDVNACLTFNLPAWLQEVYRQVAHYYKLEMKA